MRLIRPRIPALRGAQRLLTHLVFGALAAVCLPHSTENAVANGDTRTIYLHHSHTGEDIAATFRKDGVYDKAVLSQLNHFLRDWRNDDETSMDPRLFDVIWETYRESGSRQPIWVVSAYRSPVTNAMLRRRSKAVAEHSQHMLGKAMDMHYMDVPMSRIREIGMRLQRGGVGYYPNAGTPFVHLDVGNVRYWPRMSYDQLARLFPDGKAVFMAADGRTLPRYEEARAEIEQRGSGFVAVADSGRRSGGGLLASLFGFGRKSADDEDDETPAPAPVRSRVASVGRATGIGPRPDDEDATPARSRLALARVQAKADPANADRNLPRGQTFIGTQQQTAALAAGDVPLPLPPRRPAEFAATVLAEAPLPPSRPVQLASADMRAEPIGRAPNGDALGRLIDTNQTPVMAGLRPSLPSVITHGTAVPPPPAATPSTALAYAPTSGQTFAEQPVRTATVARAAAPALARTVGLRAGLAKRRSVLVAARLDRATFAAYTAGDSLSAKRVETDLGASLMPLRAAARLDAVAVGFSPTPILAGRFMDGETLSADSFSGSAAMQQVAHNETR